MADIIDKIGKYFSEQEVQLCRVYVQAAASATPVQQQQQSLYPGASRLTAYRAQLPSSSAAVANPLGQTEQSPGRCTAREQRPPSLLRRRLSLQSNGSRKSGVDDIVSERQAEVPRSIAPRAIASVPPLASMTFVRRPAMEMIDDAWSDLDEDGFASWRSPRPRDDAAETPRTIGIPAHPEVESSDGSEEDDDNTDESRLHKSSATEAPKDSGKPGKLLRRRSSIRKKRRPSSSKTSNNEPDPEQLQREKEQKVAAALSLAQERAKRIQLKREQRLRDQELARVEEQLRVQDEMNKIEAIRRKSKQFALRLRPSSAPTTPIALSESLSATYSSSSPQNAEMVQDDDAHKSHEDFITEKSSTETAIASYTNTKVMGAESFLDNLERQLRDKMVIDLRIREKSVDKHLEQGQQLARMQCEIDKLQARTAGKQKRVQSLTAMKSALEKELQDVSQELSASRLQRVQLEETSRKERAQRQKDAERQLKAQLRTEEWNRMMDDEKVRSEIAADARARASQRVVPRASNLKKTERRRSSSNSYTGNQSEGLGSEWLKLRTEKNEARSALLFPPELAEFEEEGLSLDASLVAGAPAPSPASIGSVPREPSVNLSEMPGERPLATASAACSIANGDAVAPESQKLEWRVLRFDDYELFEKLLAHDMLLSSDEE
uniref:Uncharacterized protein n=1 Tax=Globisporangium ultimum (strain ATCC 200006 / CBS 805.95 / DAOM BR144) TaxID=431595 RepID=K3X1M6_GLOUD